jgi:hypothetical protein
MRRPLFFAYGLGNYLLFFAVYAWLACFVGDVLIPRTIDYGPAGDVSPTRSLAWAASMWRCSSSSRCSIR